MKLHETPDTRAIDARGPAYDDTQILQPIREHRTRIIADIGDLNQARRRVIRHRVYTSIGWFAGAAATSFIIMWAATAFAVVYAGGGS